jgi:histidine kinase/DNA gyrase B/HSP90-like ATPase
MPFGYEATRLWKESLGTIEDDQYDTARTRLRAAYLLFRDRAAQLAGEIPQDLRDYTVHDITHSDALWELADYISGPKIELTPTEGFVLGGAFLIHDLGMALASFPGGIAELMSQPNWTEILSSCVSEGLGRPADTEDLKRPTSDALEQAKRIALRENHARHAAGLALQSWSVPGGTSYHLIENEELRENYGNLIGRIAASHGWGIDRLVSEFPRNPKDAIGAPVDCPDEWKVDPLKLACLLRLADAAHLDSRRAPGFLRAIRRPAGLADAHWAFQGHLQRPRLEEDYLVYTASRPFTIDEASPWWLCFETLQMVDKELHSVDALMIDCSRDRMAARSVKGADSPFRLSSLIPTEGWAPVDARVEVTNVPSLIKKLGGASLYGEKHDVALRELIQNASDASLALSAIAGAPTGPIEIRLTERGGSWYLEVVDNGIGMSRQVMTGPLLDFGSSYWGSQLMRTEAPGLAATGFRAVGRFGIGFYSAFMLGSAIKVVSRRFDEAVNDARALEFFDGLYSRPIIRKASREEQRFSSGTSVCIRLASDPYSPDELLDSDQGRRSLAELCASIAPGLPCDLVVTEPGQPQQTCVKANDWKSIEPEKLAIRLTEDWQFETRGDIGLNDVATRLRTIERDGAIIARATLAPGSRKILMPDGETRKIKGVLTSHGLQISELDEVVGIFEGNPTTAARSKGNVLANPDELAKWGSEQVKLWKDEINSYPLDNEVDFLIRLGAAIDEGIYVCCCREGYLDLAGLRTWAENRDRVVAVSTEEVDVEDWGDGAFFWDRTFHGRLDLDVNTLITPWSVGAEGWSFLPDIFPDKRWKPLRANEYSRANNSRHWWYFNQKRIGGVIVKCIAESWGKNLEPFLEGFTAFYFGDGQIDIPVMGAGEGASAIINCEWVAEKDSSKRGGGKECSG